MAALDGTALSYWVGDKPSDFFKLTPPGQDLKQEGVERVAGSDSGQIGARDQQGKRIG
jgi:hypothetical protein